MKDFFETPVTNIDGKIRMDDRAGFDRALQRMGRRLILRVETFDEKRSAAQNRYWHGVVIPLFADHCGERFADMKDTLALHLIPKTVKALDGSEHKVPGHTSDLTVKEFNELIERAQQLGAEMDIYIPDPGEYLKETA